MRKDSLMWDKRDTGSPPLHVSPPHTSLPIPITLYISTYFYMLGDIYANNTCQ
jgi:hypothetical protein